MLSGSILNVTMAEFSSFSGSLSTTRVTVDCPRYSRGALVLSWQAIVAVLAAGLVSSFTDWLFMGVLFSSRYKTYPETWWPRATKADETKPILYSTIIGFITAAGVIALCAITGTHGLKADLILAAIAWAAGPLVVCITNGLWVRIDPAVTFAHSVGYLVRFLIAAVAASFVLP